MSHWRDVPAGEAVRHRLYGIHETLGIFRAGLLLEPVMLIPLGLAVVLERSAADLYLFGGEVGCCGFGGHDGAGDNQGHR